MIAAMSVNASAPNFSPETSDVSPYCNQTTHVADSKFVSRPPSNGWVLFSWVGISDEVNSAFVLNNLVGLDSKHTASVCRSRLCRSVDQMLQQGP